MVDEEDDIFCPASLSKEWGFAWKMSGGVRGRFYENMRLELRIPVDRYSFDHRHRQSINAGMPKVKTTRTKPPPEGYEEIEAV
jgi:hypothetical protein